MWPFSDLLGQGNANPAVYLFKHFQHGFETSAASQTLNLDVSVHTQTKASSFPPGEVAPPCGHKPLEQISKQIAQAGHISAAEMDLKDFI